MAKTRWLIKGDLLWLKAHLTIMLKSNEWKHKEFWDDNSKQKAEKILNKINTRLNKRR